MATTECQSILDTLNLDFEFDHDDDRRWVETHSHPDAKEGCSIEHGQEATNCKKEVGMVGWVDVMNFEKGEVVAGVGQEHAEA